MSYPFPPVADHFEEVSLLLEALASVVEGRTALYVSSPLTTGPRAFEWHLRNRGGTVGDSSTSRADAFSQDVIEPNRREAAVFARNLRETSRCIVIDPTAMKDLPGWSQSDYHAYWRYVIQRYVETVVLRNGWMYSSGCAYEFLVAWSSGVRLLDEDLAPLTLDQGRSLISDAAEESRARGTRSEFLEKVLHALNPGTAREEAG
jgi:hypothetical protein